MKIRELSREPESKSGKARNDEKLTMRQLSALWTLLIVLSIFFSLLFAGSVQLNVPEYRVGDIAAADVVVPFDFSFVDQPATEARRKAARANVLPVYRYESTQNEVLVARLRRAFQRCRQQLVPVETAGAGSTRGTRINPESLSPEAKEAIRSELNRLGDGVAEGGWVAVLVREGFSAELEALLVEAVGRAYSEPVVQDEQSLIREKGSISMIPSVAGEERVVSVSMVSTLQTAQSRAEAWIQQQLKRNEATRPDLRSLVSRLIVPNLSFDQDWTDLRQEQAAHSIVPVKINLKKGRIVTRRGDEIRHNQLDQLEALRTLRQNSLSIKQISGKAFLIASLLLILGYFLRSLSQLQWTYWRLILLVSLILMTNVLLLKAFWFVYEALSRDFVASPFNDKYYFFFALPFAFGTMLLALLAGERTALIFSIFYCVLAGLGLESDFYGFFYILMTNLIGNLAVRKAVQRVGIVNAGFKLGLASVGLFVVLQISKQAPFDLSIGLFGAALSFLSGPLNTGLLIFLLPIFERLFMVTTDIRLLELGNLNLPVIRELILKAPGTYNHSVAVGTLSEGAAKAVGLNPVFVRVACLYHDIGKSVHPEYYVENQQRANIHDEISPLESSRMVCSHVADGIRMAEEARLPSNIVDIIPQHHGTKRLTYFFEKAKRQAAAEGTEVREEDFRYPGPKPQTKAAAIVMLADAVEAAARTLKEHSQEKLLEVIQRIVATTTEDGQFSECDITLGEIDRISFSFLETLSSIYHSRISYPGFDFDKKTLVQHSHSGVR